MPTVHVDLRELPGIAGADINVTSLAELHVYPWRATAIEEDGGYILTQNPLIVPCPNGLADFVAPATPTGTALVIREYGFNGARIKYVLVPDTTDVDYEDLVEVDPNTLISTLTPDAAWWAELDNNVIAGTVDGSGDLILTHKDASTTNAGHVEGAPGADGAAGPPGGPAPGTFYVDDYPGVDPTGATDSTTGIQACIDATQPGSSTTAGITGAKILFGPGEYVISDTLNFYQYAGTISGVGISNPPNYSANPGSGTVIRWNGPNTKSMFKLRDYAHVTIEDIRFEGKDAAKPTYAIESNWLTGDGAGTSSNLVVQRCQIGTWPWSSQGVNKGLVQTGIGFTGDNGNNDQFRIRDTVIEGALIGMDLPNSQSIWGLLDTVMFSNCTTAGVRTSASMTWLNVAFNNCTKDLIGQSTAAVHAFGWQSEGSGQLVDLTSVGRVSVIGGWWHLSSPMTTASNFIDVQFATENSGVSLKNLVIFNALGSPHPKIKVRATGGGTLPGYFIMRDCRTTMAIGDFDIASITTNALKIDIDVPAMPRVRQSYTTATTLTEAVEIIPGARLSGGVKAGTASTDPTLGLSGTGSPEGVVTAPVGSEYTDTAATRGAVKWIKTTGVGNTGWGVLFGDTGLRNIDALLNSPAVANTVRLRRVGSRVDLYIALNSATPWTAGNTLLALPAGFRPPHSRFLHWGYTGTAFPLTVQSGGNVLLDNAQAGFAASSGTWDTNEAWPASLPGSAA